MSQIYIKKRLENISIIISLNREKSLTKNNQKSVKHLFCFIRTLRSTSVFKSCKFALVY